MRIYILSARIQDVVFRKIGAQRHKVHVVHFKYLTTLRSTTLQHIFIEMNAWGAKYVKP